MKIANVMKKTESYTVRILEELTNHYFLAEDFFQLKQTIATIDTFLLLFNPYTKYDLCRYWQVLEGKGYDPVVEYNNGLELFDMHYSPKPEDLFTIILQISRFLKEFSDFETKNTPKFRHPFIKGKIIMKRFDTEDDFVDALDQNLEITDSRVIEKNPMFIKNRSYLGQNSNEKRNKETIKKKDTNENNEEIEAFGVLHFLKTNSKEAKKYIEENIETKSSVKDLPFKEDMDTLYADIEPKLRKKEETVFDIHKLSFLEDIGLLDEIKAMNMTEDLFGEVLSKHEVWNFDVASGKVSFILFFKTI